MAIRRLKDLNYIYERTKNPINNENVEKIINAYLENGDFYDNITRINNNIVQAPNPEQIEKFECFIFNLWKNNLINYSLQNNSQKEFDTYDYYSLEELKKYLSRQTDVTSMSEIKKVEDELNSKYLYAMLKYGPKADPNESYFRNIMSKRINIGKNNQNMGEIEHRLYINVDNRIKYSFLKQMVLKMNEQKLPYYFKYSNDSDAIDRDDAIVIYSDNSHLSRYIEVLNEIKKEHREYEFYIGKPPILSAVIDNWIGYGTEPLKHYESFNSKRSNNISEAIYTGTLKYIFNNRNEIVNINSNNIRYKDYLTYIISNYVIDSLKNKTRKLTNNDLKLVRKFELKSLRKDIIEKNRQNIDNILKEKNSTKKYNVKLKVNGEIIESNPLNFIKDLVSSQIEYLNNNYPDYKETIKEEILKSCSKQNIDKNNYAFDLYISKNLKKQKETYKPIISRLLERGAEELNKMLGEDKGDTIIANKDKRKKI